MVKFMMNSYLILVLSICLLYYLLFIYKFDRRWRTLALVGTLGGMLASVEHILEEYFVTSKTILHGIFTPIIFIALFTFFCLAIPMAWRERKNPSKKVMIYTAFGLLVILLISVIIVFILLQVGFYSG
jgi:hypothetical protein